MLHLLIVDDDVATVDVIRGAIPWETLGIGTVAVAYNITQARLILEKGKTDIVISDIEMPKGSGLDLLHWVRENHLPVAFLLLTCHERFDYAASALKLEAAEYLTKPFDAQLMTLSLQKTIARIQENRRLKEGSLYGEWRAQNLQREEINFWLSLYNGGAPRQRENIQREIQARGLPIDPAVQYRMVVTRIAEYETQARALGQSLLNYILENAHARYLFGQESNTRAIRRISASGFWYYTAVENLPDAELRHRCTQVIATCADAGRVKATCCIGKPTAIEHLADQTATLERLVERSVAFYTQAFTQEEAIEADGETHVLDTEVLKDCLLRHDKIALLNAVKEALASRTALKTLSERTLYLIQQELLQVVYAHLAEAGLQAAQLFADEDSARLSDHACRSAVDMLRWVSYLLERAFACEDELRKAGTLVERINLYLHEHYHEDIGRNEIAAQFHLAPEYLAKLYKRKTGQSLKDALREYRVEQAKRLLRDPQMRVSDVAGAVGFDNFSYFSTVFKKEVGITPQEFQREHSHES